MRSRVAVLSVVWLLVLVTGCSASGAQPVAANERVYVVVVSSATYTDHADWRAVADALVAKHHGHLVKYEGDVSKAQPLLSAWMPDTVCFVVRPEEAGKNYVIAIHRMMRRLDGDPYTDAAWGIVTGYTAEDALRVAQRKEPLVVERGASGTGTGYLNNFKSGFASGETEPHKFWVKRADGSMDEQKVEPDPAEALAKAFGAMKPQFFVTSGHASAGVWEIGYNIRAGVFTMKDGQLFAVNSAGRKFPINSPEPKVYLPAGNCSIGEVIGRDCMVTAWIHTGGVYQMIGYTVPTFYGRMGWGTLGMFLGGRHSLADSFYWTNQSVVRDLLEKHPKVASVEFDQYDSIEKLVTQYRLADQEELGLLWDRDVVAFYGDPAWVARVPVKDAPWKAEFTKDKDGTLFTLTPTADLPGPFSFETFLPERLTGVQVVSGAEYKPILTDNFLMLNIPGGVKKDAPIRIRFTGQPMARFDLGLLPEAYRNDVSSALVRAGNNRNEMVTALQNCPERQREGMAFLLANMRDVDLRSLKGSYIVENVNLAYKARTAAPWTAKIPADIFLNDVLPYANLDEPRDSSREKLFNDFSKEAWAKKSPGEAAKFLNAYVFSKLNVRYHATRRPRPNMSPSESIENHYASCTGLSILLVDACRAVGIPARVAGVPEWPGGGNHTWVEVWDGEWRSLGAAEPAEFDRGWFMRRAGTTDLKRPECRIYAASFRRTGTNFILSWDRDDNTIPAVDVSEYYRKLANPPK